MKSALLGLALACTLAPGPGCSSRSDSVGGHAGSGSATAAATPKDPAAAKQAISAGALVIDVRTPDEFAGGHLEGAINMPVQELSRQLADIQKLAGERTRPIVLYCGSGRRAGNAKQMLEAEGYTRVINGGGLADLE
ncbi:MAG: rhodanese-like domain-containing protein [Kofleriaceae bacterium]